MILCCIGLRKHFRNKIVCLFVTIYFGIVCIFDVSLFSYVYKKIDTLDYDKTTVILTIAMVSLICCKVIGVIIGDIVAFCKKQRKSNQIGDLPENSKQK